MRRRLLLVAFATTALVVLSVIAPFAFAVRRIARDRAVRDGELRAQSLVPVLAVVSDRATVDRALAETGSNTTSIVLPDGSTAGPAVPESPALLLARSGEAVSVSGKSGSVEVYTPVTDGSGTTAVIVVRVPRDELERGVATAWLLLGVLGVGVLAVALLVNDRLARSIVTPMRRLAETTERLQRGDLAARAGDEGPVEVRAAARTLNQLADRIGAMLVAEREHVADLSHRLRTPLTALRLEAEVLADPRDARRIGESVQEITNAVDRLIRDARERGVHDVPALRGQAPMAGCDAAVVVRDRMAFWQVLAEDQQRPLRVQLPDQPTGVAMEADELAAALDAVVGNIFVHTPVRTGFSVELHHSFAAVLVVEDEGPGLVDPSALARGASTAGSTGLGLDIVRKTVDHAGGRLTIGAHSRGPGTRVVIELPYATT